MNEKCIFCFSFPGLDLSCLYIWLLVCEREMWCTTLMWRPLPCTCHLPLTRSRVPTCNMHRWHFSALSATMSPLSRFSPSRARANACLHQHIDLDYNLICCGRDGIEQQIIPNEENQSPGVQISRKLVRSDWFGHRRRLGGIWQITASQVDWENSGE